MIFSDATRVDGAPNAIKNRSIRRDLPLSTANATKAAERSEAKA
jgi:hypothetical protein